MKIQSIQNIPCLVFSDSDNDQEKEWEEQQIRKGTSMPQVLNRKPFEKAQLQNKNPVILITLLCSVSGTGWWGERTRILRQLPAALPVQHTLHLPALGRRPQLLRGRSGRVPRSSARSAADGARRPGEEDGISARRQPAPGHHRSGQKTPQRQVRVKFNQHAVCSSVCFLTIR